MGMYDSIMLKVKCPSCGVEEERELQTKDTYCMFQVWKQGDYVDDSLKRLDVIVECTSEKCWDPNKNGGYGIGKFFYGQVFLKRGIVTGKYRLDAAQ